MKRSFFFVGGATAFAKARRPNFAKLASAIRSHVYLPGHSDWDRARKLWNSRFDHVRPAAVIEAATVADVQHAVRFARDYGLRVIPRNGRHSFAGDSTSDGAVIIDVSRLNGLQVNGERATIGAGLTLFPVYQGLWHHKKSIPAGRCPSVGVTGLTTVGGIGYLTRLHGPTCDSVRSAEIVDAEGRLLRASDNENSDLFWALRGAGSGSFGIVTSLTMSLVPVDMPFTSVTYDFPWSAAAKVMSVWQEWAHAVPREIASLVELITRAPEKSTPAISVEILAHGDAKRHLDTLLAAIGVAPSRTESATAPWFAVAGDAYCKGLRPQECRDAELSRDGKLPRLAFYAKSDVASNAWPAAAFETVVEWLDRRQRDRVLTPENFSPTHNIGKVFFEACDGATNDVARDATAFRHRASRFITQFQTRWSAGARASTIDANIAWTNALYDAVAPYRSGMAYQGYADPLLADWQRAYFGDNLPRLRAIKAKYDPQKFFRFARSITA